VRFHSLCFLSYSSREYFGFAGTPATTVLSGTFLVTTAPIATTLFLPIVTPAFMTDLLPIIALSSHVTPINFRLGGYGSLVSVEPGPMNTFFPILHSGGM